MARQKLTSTRADRAPKLPDRTSIKDALGYWQRFVDGEQPAFIAESLGRDQSTIQQALAYVVWRIGAPSAPMERCRLIEHHHREMERLNQLIDRSNAQLSEIESSMRDIKSGRRLNELEAEEVMVWKTLLDGRQREVAAQTKLHAEIRNVAQALDALFGLKHLAVPEDTKKGEHDAPSALDELSPDEIRQMLLTSGGEDDGDAEDVEDGDEA